MFYTMLILWTITIILLITDGKSENSRWAAGVSLSGGFGGMSRTILEMVIPFLSKNNLLTPNLDYILIICRSTCSFISQNGLPYTYLIFAISCSGLFSINTKKILKIIFFIPIVLMFLTTPFYPEIKIDFRFLDLWAVPFIIAGNCLLFISFLKEKSKSLKRSKFYNLIVATFPMTLLLINNYIARLFHFDELFRLNTFGVAIMFIAFMTFAAKDGFLGVKLKFEKKIMDGTLKAMTTGTAILNHSIKNEVFKISMCMKNIQNLIHQQNQEIDKIDENVQIVLNSTEHLSGLMKRIQEQIKEIIIMVEEIDLVEILGNSIKMQKQNLKYSNIEINCNYIIAADKIHIAEVINNILKNSIESIKGNGIINISIYQRKKEVILEISDNGCGIAKDNINSIFEPFFSTKHKTMNFGLGLSYCHNVICRHGGHIEIQSEENVGTTVFLILPFNQKALLRNSA